MFEELVLLLNQADVACFVKDVSGTYQFINAAGAYAIGKHAFEVIGHKDQDLFDSHSSKLIRDRDRQIINGGKPYIYDSVTRSNKGWQRFFSAKTPYNIQEQSGLIGLSIVVDQKLDHKIEMLMRDATLAIQNEPGHFIRALTQVQPKRLAPHL